MVFRESLARWARAWRFDDPGTGGLRVARPTEASALPGRHSGSHAATIRNLPGQHRRRVHEGRHRI